MGIVATLQAVALDAAGDIRVADVRIGLSYTAVLLEDGRCGVAYTFREPEHPECAAFEGLAPLAGKPASALLPLIGGENLVASAVGTAAANAVISRTTADVDRGDVLEHLCLQPTDTVGMVGHFAPMVPAVRQLVAALTVFEKTANPQDGVCPSASIPEKLPGCQVALITASAVVNDTMDGILAAARNCRQVVVLGATTPLSRDVFAGTPVTLLSGIAVTSAEELLRVVSEGGGTRRMRPAVRKVNVFV